jgi:hypothetical protein
MTALFDQRTHPALNPLFAPAYLRANSTTKNAATTNSLLNFMQNIVDQNKAVLYLDVGVGGSAQRTIGENGLGEDYLNLALVLRSTEDEEVFATLASAEKVLQFQTAFERSKFGQKYLRYIENGQQVVADNNAPAIPLFRRFLEKEFGAIGTTVKKAALLTQVVRYVNKNTAPRTLDAETLAALSQDTAGDNLRDNLSERRAGIAPSGLAVSIDALGESPATVRNAIGLQSPLQPGRVLKLNELNDANLAQLDSTGSNNNLTRLVMFSNAQPITAGARGDGPDAPTDGTGRFRGDVVPSFASAEFTEIVGSELVASKNIVDRFRRFGNNADWLQRVAGKMLLLAPVMQQTFDSFDASNIPLPVAFLLEQFNQRWTTSSLVWISHNPDSPMANTYYLDPDMHVGRDAVRKTIMYHMSMYLGCVINDPRRFFISHDTLVVGYGGGANAVPFSSSWSRLARSLDRAPTTESLSRTTFAATRIASARFAALPCRSRNRTTRRRSTTPPSTTSKRSSARPWPTGTASTERRASSTRRRTRARSASSTRRR